MKIMENKENTKSMFFFFVKYKIFKKILKLENKNEKVFRIITFI